jgi:phage baseplate assembly protein W
MRLFPTSTPLPSSIDTGGPAIILKPPSRWRKLFRTPNKHRRSPSLSSAASDSTLPNYPLLGELSSASSIEDIRVVGHVQEIFLRDDTPETVTTDEEERVMRRDFLSERTIFVDAVEEMGRTETMKSVYVDALSEEEETVEVKETMEVTVVAEVHDGRVRLGGGLLI